MTNTTKLAQAIMTMAEQDKGLVLSKVEELIEESQTHIDRKPAIAMPSYDDDWRNRCTNWRIATEIKAKSGLYDPARLARESNWTVPEVPPGGMPAKEWDKRLAVEVDTLIDKSSLARESAVWKLVTGKKPYA